MSPDSARRLAAAVTGGLLGALIVIAAEALGVGDALRVGELAAPGFVIGAIVGVTRIRPALWWCAGFVTLVLAIAAYTPLTGALIRPLERIDPAGAGKVGAVVVLSGGITDDGAMRGETLSRLLAGLKALREHRADTLVISREWLRRPGRGPRGDSADVQSVLDLAQAAFPVYFIDSATSTRDEALRFRSLARAHRWAKIALVTSPLHTRRACATFETAGLQVTCIAATEREFSLDHLSDSGDRLRAFRGWFYEMAGTAKYRAEGWIR